MLAIANHVPLAVGVCWTAWLTSTLSTVVAVGVVIVANAVTHLAFVVLNASRGWFSRCREFTSWMSRISEGVAHRSLRLAPALVLVPVTKDLVPSEACSGIGCVVQCCQDGVWPEALFGKETPEVVSVHLPDKCSLQAVMVCIASLQIG